MKTLRIIVLVAAALISSGALFGEMPVFDARTEIIAPDNATFISRIMESDIQPSRRRGVAEGLSKLIGD